MTAFAADRFEGILGRVRGAERPDDDVAEFEAWRDWVAANWNGPREHLRGEDDNPVEALVVAESGTFCGLRHHSAHSTYFTEVRGYLGLDPERGDWVTWQRSGRSGSSMRWFVVRSPRLTVALDGLAEHMRRFVEPSADGAALGDRPLEELRDGDGYLTAETVRERVRYMRSLRGEHEPLI